MRTFYDWRRAVLKTLFVMSALSLFVAVSPAGAADEKEAAKNIFSKWEDAVITIKATIKVRVIVGGAEQVKEENEVETLGTVIDPSGVTVLSFSAIDPSRVYGGLLKKLKAAGEGPQVDINSDITGLTMVMPDGREIPAKVVLRDGDLDLAFVKPAEKQEKPFPALDISAEGRADVLDTIVILGRLDKVAGRGPSVTLSRVEAVIATPRKYYVADNGAIMGRLGAPVFTLDGKVVGFALIRITKSADKSRMGSFLSGGMNALGIMPVILPSGEVNSVARQALESKEK